jgi:hypothetical protein
MFIPGETIIHKFYIPFITQDVSKVWLTYKQNGGVILEKEMTSIEPFEGTSVVSLELSQEESLLFKDDAPFLAQVNVLLTNGARCASHEMRGISGTQQLREVVTGNG